MSRMLRQLALACIVTGIAGGTWAQVRSIYTCVDAKGRRLTADRPIAECMDREQKELSGNGTVRRTHGPSLTAVERAAQEERDRKAAAERQRLAEETRLQKLLLARYPSQPVHDTDRAKALQAVHEAIASGQRRIAELQEQRKKIAVEGEFYKTPSQWPAKLKRQLEDNEEQLAAQQRVIATQQEEKLRISKRFDAELARLKPLWAQARTTAAAEASASLR
jgi:hypothetical protein